MPVLQPSGVLAGEKVYNARNSMTAEDFRILFLSVVLVVGLFLSRLTASLVQNNLPYHKVYLKDVWIIVVWPALMLQKH